MIAYPIRYPIGSHRVNPNRGRIPRPVPSRPQLLRDVACIRNWRQECRPVRLAALPHTPCDALAPLAGEES